jgi:predicted kinase
VTPELIVLIGAPGSGKSTWATARYQPMAIVSLDEIRGRVADDEGDQATADAVPIFRAILEARCRRQLTTVVDTTAAHPDHRAELVDLGRRYQLPVAAVLFDTELAVCIARQQERARRVPTRVIADIYAAVAACTPGGLLAEGFTSAAYADGRAPSEGMRHRAATG